MAERTPSTMQGIGVIWPLTFDSANSSATEGAAIPGDAIPDQATGLEVIATGDQAAGVDLDIRAKEGGYPGPGGATFVYKPSTGSGWRGWVRPITIMSVEAVTYSGSAAIRNPVPLALSSGAVLVVMDRYDSGNSENDIVAYRRAAAGTWSSLGIIHTEDENANTDMLYPCLVQLPDSDPNAAGRVIMFYATQDTDRSRLCVAMYYSDDDGDNWTDGGEVGLTQFDSSTYAPTKLRAAYKDGQIMVLLSLANSGTGEDNFIQYASYDNGATLNQIENVADAGHADVCVVGDYFLVAWVDGVTEDLETWRGASADEDIDPATALIASDQSASGHGAGVSAGGNPLADVDLAVVATDGGEAYLYWRSKNDTYDSRMVLVTRDYGETWEQPGDSASNVSGEGATKWWDSGAADNGPRDIAGTWHRGRCVMMCTNEAGGYTEELFALYLGGYSNVTMPRSNTKRIPNHVTWEKVWTGFQLPENTDDGVNTPIYSLNTTGTASATLSSGGVRMQAATTENVYYEYDGPSGSLAEGLGFVFQVSVASGTAQVAIRIDSGTTRYDVQVRITESSNTIDFRDLTADSSIGSSTSFDVSEEVMVLVWIRSSAARCWATGGVHNADKEWTLIGNTASLTSDTGAAANHRIRFGNRFTYACDATYKFVGFVSDEYTGVIKDLVSQFNNPGSLTARPFSTRPVYVVGDTLISAKGGPAYPGDSWSIEAGATHPIANLDPLQVPSPAVEWRSIAAAADMTLVYDLGSTAEDYDVGNDLVFFYFDRINFADCKIEYRRGSSWTTLGTLDVTNTVTYARRGSAIVCSVAGEDRYYRRNELKGGYFNNATDVRTISGNTEGSLEATADTYKAATVYLSDHDSGDASSGFGEVWEPSALVLAHLAGVRDWESIRLTLRTTAGSSPAGAEGYHKIGTFCMGHVAVIARDPSEGTSRTIEPNVQVLGTADGQRRTRQAGDPRYIVEVPFTDARSALNVSGVDNPGDYITGSGVANSEPVADWEDFCYLIEGLIDEHPDGAPVVWIPYIPRGSTGNQFVQYPGGRGAMLTRLLAAWTWNNVTGREHDAEVTRGGTLAMERER